MNIRQAVDLNSLQQRRPPSAPLEKKSGVAITARIFSRAEESGQPITSMSASVWTKEWLASETFYLLDLPTHLASVPKAPEDHNKVLSSMTASVESMEPIIVDYNKNKIGQQPNGKFFPPIIVVDGKHRHRATQLLGRERIKAWVGEVAATHLGLIHADHQIGSSELQQKIRECLQNEYPRPTLPTGGFDYSAEFKTPWIQEVYPLENYFVYQYDNHLFKQSYKVDTKTRDVSFTGKKKEVVQRYVNAGSNVSHLSKNASPIESAMRAHGGSFTAKPMKATGAGGPGASLGSGSGANPANPSVKKADIMSREAGGYKGYKNASKTMSDKTKGASNSEMAQQLKGSGYYGFDSATKTQQVKNRGGSKSDMAKKLSAAAVVKKIITRYKAALKAGKITDAVQCVAPPGMESTVKGLKKHFKKGSASPFKLAWYLHNEKKGV